MITVFIFSVFSFLTSHIASPASQNRPPNILFIAVDDLRPEMGIYGNPIIKTPSMDKLAQEGVYFTRHYVQVPTCGASRYSLLTGRRPSQPIHLNNDVFYKKMAPTPEMEQPESFVHRLRRNGYTTVGIGKISHSVDGKVYGYEEEPSQIKEMPNSWDRFLFNPGKWKTGWNAFFAYANGENRQSMNRQVPPYEKGEVEDEGYPDGLILRSATEELAKLKKDGKPFFLGVGFFKPHLPFNAPKKYWDRYEPSSIPLPTDSFIPLNSDSASLGNMGEFNSYQLSDEKPSFSKPLSDEYSRKLIHAYYASVSYIDHLIGKLLSELQTQGLDKNTIVVLWGDHGWHLGNDLKWGKHTLFERSLRSALIIKIPEMKTKKNEIQTITESIDLYPTLMELCDIPLEKKYDGKSLVNIIKNGSAEEEKPAYSFWQNSLSIRTNRYRLSKFYRNKKILFELYDHLVDPEENNNIAADRPDIVRKIQPLLELKEPSFYSAQLNK